MKKEKTIPTPVISPQPKTGEVAASKEEFEKLKRKVFALHDGLFRRLAEHDRQH